MDVATAVERLGAAGTEQNRRIYRRHGARDPLFGVSLAVLDRLAREAGCDQVLAEGLWATGGYEARILACRVADPAAMSEAALDAWLDELDAYVLVDAFAVSLASLVPGVRERADRWSASDRDWTAQAGWDLYVQLALRDGELDDGSCLGLLARVEADIGAAGNRTRYAMNNAVIAIGSRNPALRTAAEAAAGRIGVVTVDHGETGCGTPAAIPYLAKVWDHKLARAGVARG